MEFFKNLDQIIAWLENKAILSCHDSQYRRYMQIEWQLAEQLRTIRKLTTDEDWDGLKEFINRGVR